MESKVLNEVTSKFKHLFPVLLEEFSNDSTFKALISMFSLSQFTFETLPLNIDPYYKDNIIDFVSTMHNVSNIGNTSALKVFNWSTADVKSMFVNSFDDIIKYGNCIIIKNIDNNIIGFMSFMDGMNDYFITKNKHFPVAQTSHSYTKNISHFHEVYDMMKNDFWLNKLSNDKFVYGEYVHAGWLVIDKNYRNLKLHAVLRYLIKNIIAKLGYKYQIAVASNSKTFQRDGATKMYDFSSFVFKDGTSIHYYLNQVQQDHPSYSKNSCKMQAVQLESYKEKNKMDAWANKKSQTNMSKL